ncbi:MAG: TetR/AcrR family transcriptional regulator [Caldicoprobacterales bacterium]|jgi:AcrR family transcriptional regulator|nr:TetR/AcrR family transcriptional regulator [Clostridiales bacterium]
MPKLIENAKELILETSKKLLFEVGYEGFKIREVASRCGIATGTIFNYFASKEMLIASIIAKDWINYLDDIKRECDLASDIASGVTGIYKGIEAFSKKYESIWMGYSGDIIGRFGKHHLTLRGQIADILSKMLLHFEKKLDKSVVNILAETVLASAVQKDIGLTDLLRFTAMLIPNIEDK